MRHATPRSHEELHHQSVDAITEQAAEFLREHSERVTVARTAVVRVLAVHTNYLSAETIVDLVHAAHPEVHRATVYRTIDLFVELGMISRLPGDGGANTYHLLLVSHSSEHLHGQCRICHRIIHLPTNAFAQTVAALTPAFTWEPSQSSLIGLCENCATSVP